VARVRIYTLGGCPHCAALKLDLNACGVEYEELHAEDPGVRDKLVKMGVDAVPVIEVDGRVTVGYSREWVKKNLCGLSGRR
jgi:glutaredoxin